MKSITNYLNEQGKRLADDTANEFVKKNKNKIIKFKKLCDMLEDEGWYNYDESESDNNNLCFWGNFSNHAEGDDVMLCLKVDKKGDDVEILDYTIEK